MAWTDILQIVGLAGIVSAVVTAGIRWWFEWQDRNRRARYLALRVSLVLEGYFNDCADRALEIETYIGSRGMGGTNYAGLPPPPEYPDDQASWMLLNQQVAEEVLSFPAHLRALDDGISFDIYMDGDPEGPDPEWTLRHLYGVAFDTIALARRVRATHGLPGITRTERKEKDLKECQAEFEERLASARRSATGGSD